MTPEERKQHREELLKDVANAVCEDITWSAYHGYGRFTAYVTRDQLKELIEKHLAAFAREKLSEEGIK